MNETKIIRPRSGVLVRDPHTFAKIPEEGCEVHWTGRSGKFWRRRLRCKDIEIVSSIDSSSEESDEEELDTEDESKEDSFENLEEDFDSI